MAIASNRLVPIAAVAFAVLAAFILIKSVSTEGKSPAKYAPMNTLPQVSSDADTTADTLRTLTATVEGLNKTVAEVKGQNEKLKNERKVFDDKLGERVKEAIELERKNKGLEKAESAPEMASLAGKVEQLSKQVAATLEHATPTDRAKSVKPDMAIGSDIPPGLGFDNLNLDALAKPISKIDLGAVDHIVSNDAVTWIKPLDVEYDKSGKPIESAQSGEINTKSNDVAKSKKAKDSIKPVYTIPENATLIGSLAFTALIGRIPVDGKVQDPWPFKVLIGKSNLASNGVVIPGIEAMVASGSAVGDWTLSCVRGEINSVTFTFEDGTIVTKNVKSQSEQKNIAWISDERGVPCITGQRITNAASYLAGRAGLLALETAADAYAAAQTTTSESDTGRIRSSVTGDIDKFVAGKAIKGGVAESADWLRERQKQSFDVVYVKPGAEVELHINTEIPIDYDQQGRRVSYAARDNRYSTNLD